MEAQTLGEAHILVVTRSLVAIMISRTLVNFDEKYEMLDGLPVPFVVRLECLFLRFLCSGLSLLTISTLGRRLSDSILVFSRLRGLPGPVSIASTCCSVRSNHVRIAKLGDRLELAGIEDSFYLRICRLHV